MEGVIEGDDLLAGTCAAGQFDCGLDGFSARVAEIHSTGLARTAQSAQPVSKLDLRPRSKIVGDVSEGSNLTRDSLDEHGVSVAERVHCNSRKKVEVLLSLAVPDPRALSTH